MDEFFSILISLGYDGYSAEALKDNWDELKQDAFVALVKDGEEPKTAWDKADEWEFSYLGADEDMESVAYNFIQVAEGGVESLPSEILTYYFDFKKYAEDLLNDKSERIIKVRNRFYLFN